MIPLQVHITAGPQAGTRLQLTQTPVSFGRSPECTLVLDLAVVSRNHGELRFEDDAWWLYNLSQNGTKVGRKRVTKKPRELAEGDAVAIGDEEVFRVYYARESADAAAAAAAPDAQHDDAHAQQPDAAPPGTGLRGRSKLWLFLGVWFALCLGLFILAATTCEDPTRNDTPRNTLTRYQSSEEIHQVLRQEVQRETPDDYPYSQAIGRARDAYATREERDLYTAYEKYREALAYLPAGRDLPAEDRQRYDVVLDELATLVYEKLDRAWTLYNASSYEQAQREIDSLIQYFPANAGDNEVIDTILALRERITRNLGR